MYNVDISSHSNNFQCTIQVENHSGEKIAEFNNCEETMNLKDVNFWWPYLMDPMVRWSIFLKDISNQFNFRERKTFSIEERKI